MTGDWGCSDDVEVLDSTTDHVSTTSYTYLLTFLVYNKYNVRRLTGDLVRRFKKSFKQVDLGNLGNPNKRIVVFTGELSPQP